MALRKSCHHLPLDRSQLPQQQPRIHTLGDCDAEEQIDCFGRSEMEPAQRPVPVQPKPAAPAPFGLDWNAPVAQDLEVAIKRPNADPQLGRELRARNMLVRPQKPLELFEPL